MHLHPALPDRPGVRRRSCPLNAARTGFLAGTLVALALAGCSSTVHLRERVLNAAGTPLPGAVFVIETWRPGAPASLVSFHVAVTDREGYAPAPGDPPLDVEYPLTACETWGLFVQGLRPYVVSMTAPCPQPRSQTVNAEDRVTGKVTQFDLSRFVWPRLDDRRREQMRVPGAAPLRAALRAAGIDVSDLPDP